MTIEIISVSALGEGTEMLLTLRISDGQGNAEKRRLMIFTEQYMELGLHRGALIDGDTFDKIEEQARLCRAMRKGSELLSYSASSRKRLTSRLISRGFDRESASIASDKLCELGAIDEKRDAERVVSSCLKKLWGKRRIYNELCAKGYPPSLASSVLEELSQELMTENCAHLIAKKYGELPSEPSERKKAVASLARYGYSYSEIKSAASLLKTE